MFDLFPRMSRVIGPACVAVGLATAVLAQEGGAVPDAGQGAAGERAPIASELPMTYERLGRILAALDPEMQPNGPGFSLRIRDVQVFVITDQTADRMRAMVPIRSASDLSPEDMMRMMQANFDSALDARYAVANGTLWAVFIHPLSALEKDQLISGLAQTVNVALTYGSLYSGGGVQFGAGDSSNLQQQLIQELLKKGEEI